MLHAEFVHKSTDQEYPSTGNPQKVFGRARIGNFGDTETVTLVANANLASVYAVNGKTAAAESLLREVVERDAANPVAAEARALLEKVR